MKAFNRTLVMSMLAAAGMLAACDKNDDRDDDRTVNRDSSNRGMSEVWDPTEAEEYARNHYNPEYGPTGMNVDAELMRDNTSGNYDRNVRDRDDMRNDRRDNDRMNDRDNNMRDDTRRSQRSGAVDVETSRSDQRWTDSNRADTNKTDNWNNDPNRMRGDTDRTRTQGDRAMDDVSRTDRATAGTMAAPFDSASPDVKVLSILHTKNQEEIQIGRLAQQKATTDEARRFGDMLVNDHTENDRKLMELAQSENLILVPMDEVKRAHARMKNMRQPSDPVGELRSLNGVEFDRQFGDKMHAGHRELIQKMESMRGQLANERVRSHVDETLKVLRKHEEGAAKVQAAQHGGAGDMHTDHDHTDTGTDNNK